MPQFTFLDMAGKTLFLRDDAERAQWTQEELKLDLEFPRVENKVASIGQRVLFYDPATNAPQIYEIKNAKTFEPDHYQSITAENICISELSDEHINNAELVNKTASSALSSVLAGTLWNVGTVEINPTSTMDVSRGSVWQAVLQIKTNWNVYIEPRFTISANGTITRYLDILSPAGKWNGVRLSIDKNFLSPSVTFDDSEVVTAMYGYGGTTTPTKKEEEPKEITFADVVWQKTADHPAKPAGQTYIVDPSATAAYGRNGRARFGYYQNTDIIDPETLLQKTWESLQIASKPAISIDGTVADLYRMGYADQPIKLHDIALVEVNPAGYTAQIQIIRCTVNLVDASDTTLTIGSYIPNIIYIENQNYENITGDRGPTGKNSKQSERSEYETAIEKNNREIRLRAYQNDLDDLDNDVKKQEARITIEHNRITQEVTDRRNADNVLNSSITVQANRITTEVTERQRDSTALSARITVEAGRITQEVSDRTASYANLDSRITQTAREISLEVDRASRAEGQLSGRITVAADAITQEVTNRANADSELSGRITVTANAITQEVTNRTNADTELSGRIQVTSDAISAEVTNRTNADNQLSGRIDVNSDKVSLVVSETTGGYTVNSAEIVAGINGQTGSYVKIKADTINLSGYVTATDLESTNARISNLTSGATTASSLKTQILSASTGFTYQGHSIGLHSVTISGTTYYFMGYKKT